MSKFRAVLSILRRMPVIAVALLLPISTAFADIEYEKVSAEEFGMKEFKYTVIKLDAPSGNDKHIVFFRFTTKNECQFVGSVNEGDESNIGVFVQLKSQIKPDCFK